MQVMSNKSKGFTIVELVVVISVLGILMAVVLDTLGGFYQSNTTSLGQTNQDTDTRGVLRSIENELTNSAGFSANYPTTGPAVIPLGSKNDTTAWSYLGNDSTKPNNKVLIASTYATDKPQTDDTRMIVFTDTGSGCTPGTATPMKNALIYFAAKDSNNQYNLYRRTIVNTTGGVPCSTPVQKQTCAAISTSNLYPLICKGTDAMLLRNIDTFNVDYYTSPNDPSSYALAYNTDTAVVSTFTRESTIENAKSIKITVTTKQLIDGKQTTNTASIRVSRPY